MKNDELSEIVDTIAALGDDNRKGRMGAAPQHVLTITCVCRDIKWERRVTLENGTLMCLYALCAVCNKEIEQWRLDNDELFEDADPWDADEA